MLANPLAESAALSFNSLFGTAFTGLGKDDVHEDTFLPTDVLTSSSEPSNVLNPVLASSIGTDGVTTSTHDVVEPLTVTEPDILEILEAPLETASLFDESVGSEAIAPNNLGGLYDDPIEFGTPLNDAWYWRQQQGSASCAVVAQISVFQSLTGQYISETDACNFAQAQGWFDPITGTPTQYMGNILDSLGIATYEYEYATLAQLQTALAYGNKPIVGLDANEIWNPQYDWFGNPLELSDAGHAVWVTGIDYEQDGSVNIILNDSGTPTGMASVVDYWDFVNAWQDYDYFVSIADNPFT